MVTIKHMLWRRAMIRWGLAAGVFCAMVGGWSVGLHAATPRRGAATTPSTSPATAPAKPPLTVATLFPKAGDAAVCIDTPLKITFASTPTLGTAGKIQILDAENDAVVDTIDLSNRTPVKTIGGLGNFRYYPVIITGNEAAIYPTNSVLRYGKKYYVKIEAGVFKNAGGDFAGMTDKGAWGFSTKAAGPAAAVKSDEERRFTVAADGTGDYCTVQGAIDSIADGNTNRTTIFVRNGTYNEIVFFTNKHSLTILGEDRKKTIIAYANNDKFNTNGGSNPFGSAAGPTVATVVRGAGNIYHRGVFLAHRVNDLVIANLTVRNTTPSGGTQAETIILNGMATARAIITNVDLYSFQDTLQINGQAYVSNSYIEGDVDFMWGTGPCFFENCEAKSVRSRAYFTQIRNPAMNHGFVYVDCKFTGQGGAIGNMLSRIDPTRYPASEMVLIDCTLAAAVDPVAWRLDGWTQVDFPQNVHFWEFNSHDADGKPVNFNRRLEGSKRLKADEDQETIANYRKPAWVLGNNWEPKIPAEVAAAVGK